MANLYIGVSSKARLVKNIYIGVNGKARKVQKAYIGVGGKARLFYSASTPFAFTYTGSYATEGNLEGNFVIRFKTSGTLTIGDLGNTASKIDIFMVGGGASGGVGYGMGGDYGMGGHGGGSGYTKTVKSLSIAKGNTFKIIIGAGGESAAYSTNNDASNYTPGNNGGGQGLQVYFGHKDTGGLVRDVTGGTINTGSGGGGGGYYRSIPEDQLIRRNSGAGGSGIVCIRNAR